MPDYYEDEMKQSQLSARSYAQSAVTRIHGQGQSQGDGMSVLSGATFDTALLDPRNRGQLGSNINDDARSIQIDFDDLRSVITDITDDDAQSILTQQTIIKKWD
mmetsp:Transcript_64444/g.57921  ORF Transcript_64444/g.57921 Transcript_64444/m.57921 type:complete len:104 (-) Transcript_64444:3-314(-)